MARSQTTGLLQVLSADVSEWLEGFSIASGAVRPFARGKGAFEVGKWNAAKMLADAQDILDQVKRVDSDAIIEDLLTWTTSRGHLKAAFAVWMGRLSRITGADVARALGAPVR